MSEEKKKYCLHCELKAILEMRLEERAIDLEEALHNIAQLLGEAAIEDAIGMMIRSAGGTNIKTKVTKEEPVDPDTTRH